MTNLPPHIWLFAGGLLASLIAAALSYLALVITKENKISELRQKWIDELRNELAEFFAATRSMRIHLDILNGGTTSANSKQHNEANALRYHDVAMTNLQRVTLRLNPEGKRNALSATLITEINTLVACTGKGKTIEDSDSQIQIAKSAASKLLRYEWARVKRGEPVFYFSKWAAAILIVGLLLGVSGTLFLALEYRGGAQPAPVSAP